MSRRAEIVALALAAAALARAAAGQPSNPPDALLVAAIAAPATVSYSGVVEVVRMGSRSAEASIYRVEHRAPNFTRRVYIAPSKMAGEWVVANGDAIFSIDPKRRRMFESRNDGADDSAALHANHALLRQNYRAVLAGSDVVAGRRTIELALVSNQSRHTTMLIRVDAATKCVLEKESFSLDGVPIQEVRFEAITYASAPPLADFALPKGYAIVPTASFTPSETPERVLHDAGFAPRAPRALPGGFAAVDGNIVDLHGVRTMHLLYSDGLRTVSLFESTEAATTESVSSQARGVLVGGHNAQYAEDGPSALLTWSDDRLYYTLVGEVGIEDLPRLAAAITP